MPTSFGPQIWVDDAWSANALRFTTETEASRYAFNLYKRWTQAKDYRAAPSDDAVNAAYDDSDRLIYVVAVTAADVGLAAEDAQAEAPFSEEAELRSGEPERPSEEEQPTGHEWPSDDELQADYREPAAAAD